MWCIRGSFAREKAFFKEAAERERGEGTTRLT